MAELHNYKVRNKTWSCQHVKVGMVEMVGSTSKTCSQQICCFQLLTRMILLTDYCFVAKVLFVSFSWFFLPEIVLPHHNVS